VRGTAVLGGGGRLDLLYKKAFAQEADTTSSETTLTDTLISSALT
jgi:hypothetical protein